MDNRSEETRPRLHQEEIEAMLRDAWKVLSSHKMYLQALNNLLLGLIRQLSHTQKNHGQ